MYRVYVTAATPRVSQLRDSAASWSTWPVAVTVMTTGQGADEPLIWHDGSVRGSELLDFHPPARGGVPLSTVGGLGWKRLAR